MNRSQPPPHGAYATCPTVRSAGAYGAVERTPMIAESRSRAG
jgi:hypothetical protein